MNAADVIPALEQVAGVLANSAATSGEFSAAAELSRAAVSALDDALAGHQASKAEIFSAIAPPVAAPGKYQLRARSIVETGEAVLAHGRYGEILSARREIAVWLGAALDVRAREAAKAEAARDAARKPFEAETKRARELAKRIGEAPKLFKQVVSQFSADIVIANLGKAAWSRAPRPQGSYVQTFDGIVERMIATPNVLSSVRLPGFSTHDFSALERAFHHEDEDSEEFGAVMAQRVRELRELIRNHDQRQIAISDESVARAVARAQTALVSEYNRTCAAIRELVALDAQVTAAEAGARYPDGALIFDPALFPEHWHLGLMSKSINGHPRVALPVIDGMALAAE